MGMFDDLIPAQGGTAAKGGRPATTGAGFFDDLVPAERSASVSSSVVEPKAPDEEQGWGSWLYDGLETVGDAIGSGATNVVRGIGERGLDLAAGMNETTLAGLDALGFDTHAGFIGDSRRGTEAARKADLGYEEGTSWEDVKKAPLSSFLPFALEQGLVSAPDMVAAVTNLPAYIYARTGELGDQRAENNGVENATVGDLMATLPAAAASALLERIGTRGLFGLDDVVVKGLGEVPGAIAKSAFKEGATEAGQEGVEYAGTNLGTKKGFDLAEGGEQMLAAAVGGAGFGGAVRTATAAGEVVTRRKGAFDDLVPDGALPAEQVLDPVVPVPADRERAKSPRLTLEDRASPIPNDLIDDGKAIIEGRPIGAPAATPVAPAAAARGAGLAESRAVDEAPLDLGTDFDRTIQDAVATESDGDQIDMSAIEETIRQDVEEDLRQAAGPRPSFLDAMTPEERAAYTAAPGVNLAIARRLGVKIDEMEGRGDLERAGQLRAKLGPILESFGPGRAAPSPDLGSSSSAWGSSAPAALAAPRRAGLIAFSGDGSRRAPVSVFSAADLDEIAPAIASPSTAQAEAGNYRKGHARWQGLDLAIETPKGGKRSGVGRDGSSWEVTMPAHYGDFKGTKGADGDPVDVYVGEDPESDRVFVVDQKDAETGKFDEHKVFVGTRDEAEVAAIFEGAFSDGRGGSRLQDITETTVDGLKDWLANGNKAKPFGSQTAAREAPALPRKPVTTMLRRAGGVDPTSTLAGELRAMGITPRTAPGLFRRGGMGAADNFVRAEQPLFENGPDDGNGYVPESEILEALRREMGGDPVRTADETARLQAARPPRQFDRAQDADRPAGRSRARVVADPHTEVARLIDVYGFPDDPDVRQTAVGLIERGADPEDAMIVAYERFAEQLVQADEGVAIDEASGIPFFAGDRGFDDASVGGLDTEADADGEGIRADQPSDPEGGERGAARAEGGSRDGPAVDGRSRAPAGRPGDAQPVEAGADGKPQLVIPGAERAPDRDMARRAADALLRPNAPQKSADDGLFGSSRDQLDLVDMAKTPTPKADQVAQTPGAVLEKENPAGIPGEAPANRGQSNQPAEGPTKTIAPSEDGAKVPDRFRGRKEETGADAAILSERAADVPVATLSGNELGVDFRGPEDMPALRKAATTWYDRNLRGTTATMADGSVVSFSRKGMGKSTSSSKGDILLRAVPAIRAIIERGSIVHREPGKREGIKERLIVSAPVDLLGSIRQLAVSVHVTTDGRFHYDLTMDRDAGGPGSGARLAYREDSVDSREGAASNADTKPRSGRGGPLENFEPLPSLEAPLRRVDELNLFERVDVDKEAPAGWGSVEAAPRSRLSDAEQETVAEIVRRVAGLPKVNFPASIRVSTTAKGFEAWGRVAREGEFVPIAGYYHAVDDAIAVALDAAGDGTRLAYHESFHRLQRLFLTDQEKALLAGETEALRALVASDPGRADQAPRMAQSEIEAEAFGIYSERMDRGGAAPLRIKGRIRAAWDRIRTMVRRVRNYLRGRGYRTFEDVFDTARSGEMKARSNKPGTSGTAGPANSVTDDMQFDIAPDPADLEPQSRAQGFLAKGQPIDRAIRIPFEFFGGTDANGEWKPGKYLTEKAAKIITEARFAPDGRMSWLNGALETARAGLIDRYGLDPAYVERDQRRALDERRVMLQGAEVLKTLADQKVSVEEAKVLQAILTGEAVDDAAMQKLAAPIRVAIDELGQEAVQLGLLSADSYERNRGAYLHRVYLKHEADQSGLTKMVGKIMGNSRKKIIGDQFKGRGMFFEVPLDRLVKDDPEWTDAHRGAPVKGEKVRILDEVQTDMLDGSSKVVRRVYLPADRKTPAVYAGFRDQGVWEIRGRQNGRFVLWRDYTKAERGKMGEILDARYTIGKTYLMMAHDLATGRFYQDIAVNEDWSRKDPPAGKWADANDVKRMRIDSELQWVRVPDTTIGATGGKKRWGALAGRFVRAEIWRDLNEIEVMNNPTAWRMLLSQWKLNKTARSPVTHMNNVMSNLMFMDMADVRFQDLAAGIRSYAKGDKVFREAVENGAFGMDMISQEIRKSVLQPILDDLSKSEQNGSENSFLARAGLLGKIADRVWRGVTFLDGKMIDAYRIEDEVFRMATYVRRRQLGDDAKTAADVARQTFMDYDIRAPWVNAARNTVLPFISYTYRAAPMIAKAIAARPWKLAKYAAVAYALNALAYAWDDDGDEEKERASLRDEEQGKTWLFVPRMMRMPFRNGDGLPVFLDVRRWIPAGDVFDTNQGSSAVPIPAPLQFGGPLLMAFEIILNKQGFTGEEISNSDIDTLGERAAKTGDYLWKGWLPSAAWIPGSWYWQKIRNAAIGATDGSGRPYNLPEAMASSVGIKMKPQDVESGIEWHWKDLKDTENALRAEGRRLGRQLDRGLISQEAFDAGMAKAMEKMNRLAERARELQDQTSGR